MRIRLYADNPNYKDLLQIVQVLREGGVIIYPTITGYAYACDALQNKAVEKIYKLKGIDPRKKALSLMFEDISQLSNYCKINNTTFRFIKEHKGQFTFILSTASTLPKIFKHRKQIGARLVEHPIAKLLVEELGNPLITSSLPTIKDDPEYRQDPELVEELYGWEVDLVVDAGFIKGEASTIIDCTQEPFNLIRLGDGRVQGFDLRVE